METETREATRRADPSYGWTVRLPGRTLAEAREQVAAALKDQGFGILTEIDVRGTLKNKIGRDFRPYVILGACNPNLASRALDADLAIGLLLPCNVCVWEEDGAAVVSIARPDAMLQIADSPALRPVADEAQRRLEAVFGRIAGAT